MAAKKRPPRLPCSQTAQQPTAWNQTTGTAPALPSRDGVYLRLRRWLRGHPAKGPKAPPLSSWLKTLLHGVAYSVALRPSLNEGPLAPANRPPLFFVYMIGRNGQQPPPPSPLKTSFPAGLPAFALQRESQFCGAPFGRGCGVFCPPLSRFSPRLGLWPERERRGGRMRPANG